MGHIMAYLTSCFLPLQPLSAIFFLSFTVQILYYYGIMQWIVIKLGWLIQISMGTTVCESVNAAASVFLGMVRSIILCMHSNKNTTAQGEVCLGWDEYLNINRTNHGIMKLIY
jgi:nucleoside permease NupC